MPSSSSSSLRSTMVLLAIACLSALAVVLALVMGGDSLRRPSSPSPSPALWPASAHGMSTPFIMPGLERPATEPAATAAVPDDAEVLGVTANGRHRAYLVSALSRITSHVVNDMLDEAPVTVTFCDKSQCARVFTAPDHPTPLKVDLGGLYDDKMLLKLANVFYDQESGERIAGREGPRFPYPSHPFIRTTWKKWKEAHPDTDIFVGGPTASEKETRPAQEKPGGP